MTFVADGTWFRDSYRCTNCRSIPRERALMLCIENLVPNWRNVQIHEAAPVNRGASVRLREQASSYTATQYYPGVSLGTTHRGFRNEDLEQLTFGDESIDLHVTQDVMEHVLAPDLAFRELARTLRPGGAHIFTTPLVKKLNPSEVCARPDGNGGVVYLREPEYHCSSVSEEGALVTMHWGYDICEHIFRASGLFTTIWHVDSLELGIRAEYIEVLASWKPRSATDAGSA